MRGNLAFVDKHFKDCSDLDEDSFYGYFSVEFLDKIINFISSKNGDEKWNSALSEHVRTKLIRLQEEKNCV